MGAGTRTKMVPKAKATARTRAKARMVVRADHVSPESDIRCAHTSRRGHAATWTTVLLPTAKRRWAHPMTSQVKRVAMALPLQEVARVRLSLMAHGEVAGECFKAVGPADYSKD